MRRDNIITELEQEYGVECDPDGAEFADILCDGDTCRHSECDCWKRFSRTVEIYLIEQTIHNRRINQ